MSEPESHDPDDDTRGDSARDAYAATHPRWWHLHQLAAAAASLTTRAPDGVLERGVLDGGALDRGIEYWVLDRSATTEQEPGSHGSTVTRTVVLTLTAGGRLTAHHFTERLTAASGRTVHERLLAEERPLGEADLEFLDVAAQSRGAEAPPRPAAEDTFSLLPGVRRKGDGLARALIDLATEQPGEQMNRLVARDVTRSRPGRRIVRTDFGSAGAWLLGDGLQRRLGLDGAALIVLTTPLLGLRPILWAVTAMAAAIAYVVYVELWASDQTESRPVPALKGVLLALAAAVFYLAFMWFDEWPTSPLRLFRFLEWHGASGFAVLVAVFALCAWLVCVSLVVAFRGATRALREQFSLRQTATALVPAVLAHAIASAIALAACAGLVYR